MTWLEQKQKGRHQVYEKLKKLIKFKKNKKKELDGAIGTGEKD